MGESLGDSSPPHPPTVLSRRRQGVPSRGGLLAPKGPPHSSPSLPPATGGGKVATRASRSSTTCFEQTAKVFIVDE